MEDEELVDYIGESRMLSKNVNDYDKRKGVALTTAKRLGEFLGADITQGKGLNCFFIISQKPIGSPVADRAIPISIFSAEESIKKKFLKKWLKESEVKDLELRSILDWDYYIERLGKTIQKIITIPASFQKVIRFCLVVDIENFFRLRIQHQECHIQIG